MEFAAFICKFNIVINNISFAESDKVLDSLWNLFPE